MEQTKKKQRNPKDFPRLDIVEKLLAKEEKNKLPRKAKKTRVEDVEPPKDRVKIRIIDKTRKAVEKIKKVARPKKEKAPQFEKESGLDKLLKVEALQLKNKEVTAKKTKRIEDNEKDPVLLTGTNRKQNREQVFAKKITKNESEQTAIMKAKKLEKRRAKKKPKNTKAAAGMNTVRNNSDKKMLQSKRREAAYAAMFVDSEHTARKINKRTVDKKERVEALRKTNKAMPVSHLKSNLTIGLHSIKEKARIQRMKMELAEEIQKLTA